MVTLKNKSLLSFSERPFWDHLPALLAGGLAWWLDASALVSPVTTFQDTRIAIFSSIAALSGLVLTAATFVAALTYQSANPLMQKVRALYSVELARNWRSIILSTLLAAVGSIALLFVDPLYPRLSIAVAIYLLALTAMRGRRSVYWLMFTLFSDKLERAFPAPHPVPSAADLYPKHGQQSSKV